MMNDRLASEQRTYLKTDSFTVFGASRFVTTER